MMVMIVVIVIAPRHRHGHREAPEHVSAHDGDQQPANDSVHATVQCKACAFRRQVWGVIASVSRAVVQLSGARNGMLVYPAAK